MQVRASLSIDLETQLRTLHDKIDADPNEESKASDNSFEASPLMVVAENNQLN